MKGLSGRGIASTVREGGQAVKPPPKHRKGLGKLGEGIALGWYLLQGWRPVRRPRREAVQTDLVLRRGPAMLLVEVKTRLRPQPYERLLSPTQRQRLARQVAFWAARQPHLSIRLEVVQITPSWPWVRCYAVPLA
jgi:Holliday junction resolvase-like predicted endonuclease